MSFFSKQLNEKVICCYSGFIKNDEKLSEVASGGFGSALAEYFVSDNGIVYGVGYSKDFRSAQFIRVSNESDLFLLKGSKYIESSKFLSSGCLVYSSVCDDLLCGHKVLFFGLPCDVAALVSYLTKRNTNIENLLTVDLICHGPTVPSVSEQYVNHLENLYGSSVISLSVRYKNPNWTPSYLKADFESGETFLKPFDTTEYGKAFAIMGRESCYKCLFKGENHKSDMTIGDFWGITEDDPCYNKYGVSIAIIYNNKAKQALLNLKSICLSEINLAKALRNNPMFYLSRTPDSRLDKFKRIYEKEGLISACKKTRTVREKLKAILPNFAIQKLREFI